MWDAKTGQEILSLSGTNVVNSLAYNAAGTRLASGGGDQAVKVWDAQTGKELLNLKGHRESVNSVCFSPDGKRLASGSGDPVDQKKPREVKVWDAETGQEIISLKGHSARITYVTFSTDGNRLASASWDQTVKVWNLETGQESLTLKGHAGTVYSLAFSPDGKRLASGSADQEVKVWDADTGRPLLSLKGHTHTVFSVAYSPDGTRLASSSRDETVKVWDAITGQEFITLKDPTGTVYGLAFSADGLCLAGCSGDHSNAGKPGEVKLWHGRPSKAMPTQVDWESMARQWSTRFDPFWHRSEFARHTQANNPEGASFHFEQLIAATPLKSDLVSQLVKAQMDAARQNPDQFRTWRRLALAQLFAGQTDAALQTCQAMRQRITVSGPLLQVAQTLRPAPNDVLNVAVNLWLLQSPVFSGGTGDYDRLLAVRTGVLFPNGLPDPLAWLPAVPESEPQTRGALLCRAGKPAEALELLKPLKEPRAQLFRALAEHGRGDKNAAQQAFDEALAEMERICPSDPKADATPLPWEQRAEYEILKREAQSLLKP